MRRAPEAAGWFVLCLPLLAGASLVAAATGSALPFAAALGATAGVVAAGVARHWRRYAWAVALALFLVLASPVLDSARVESDDDLAAARFGLPFDFVEAQLSVTPPLPYDAAWNPWEDPARLLHLRFTVSAAIVVAFALAAVSAQRLVRRRGA